MIKFEVQLNIPMQEGSVVYNSEDYAFDTIDAQSESITSVVFDDVSLNVDSSGKVLYVSGLCPHTNWQPGSLEPPNASEGALRLVADTPVQANVAIRLTTPGKHLPTIVDRQNGWVKIGNGSSASQFVAIMAGVVAQTTAEGELVALWIRPENGIL